MTQADSEELLTPAQVAELFAVTPRSVARWAKNGLLPSVRTLAGQRRFRSGDIAELLTVIHSHASGTGSSTD